MKLVFFIAIIVFFVAEFIYENSFLLCVAITFSVGLQYF